MPIEGLQEKTFLITGVKNKKSLAYSVVETLLKAKAKVILSVQNSDVAQKVAILFPQCTILTCNLSNLNEIEKLALELKDVKISGLLHSVAYANFVEGRAFHEIPQIDFEEAIKITSLSLVHLSKALKDHFTPDASVVTVSISNPKATAYGYLGPVKGFLDLLVPYLAHSFSAFSEVRFNAVCSGPLRTTASAGIPNYLENYLYSKQLVLRKRGLTTQEVANTVLFLFSPLSSGINGERIIVDAGMSSNYFDAGIVQTFISTIKDDMEKSSV